REERRPMRLPKIKDRSIAQKLALSLAIAMLPVALLTYFFITERDDLIDFSAQEIAGTAYLRAATAALHAATEPVVDATAIATAVQQVRDAQKVASGLGAGDAAEDAVKAMEQLSRGGARAPSVAKLRSLISAIWD